MIAPPYRTFWRRFWAGVIDVIIFLPITIPINWIWDHHSRFPTLVLILLHILNSVMWYAYSIYLHGRYGQTLGKMALKVKVLDLTESRTISFSQAFRRDIIPLAITLVLLPHDIVGIAKREHYLMNPGTMPDVVSLILGYVMAVWALLEIITMFFSSKRRALHDCIAGSVVINMKAPTSRLNLQRGADAS